MSLEDFAVSRRELVAGGSTIAALSLLGAPGVEAATAQGVQGAPGDDMLWYRQPAKEWTEALPVGNGRIGAMVFGGVAEERLQLNEDTLWGGGPYDPVNPQAKAALPEVRKLIFEGRYDEAQALAKEKVMARPLRQMPYQGLGDLKLTFPGLGEPEAGSYRRELDIDAARHTTRFRAGGVDYERTVVASPADQVIAVHLKAGKRGAVAVDLGMTSPQKAWTVKALPGDELLLAGTNNEGFGIAGALKFQGRVKVIVGGGKVALGAAQVSVSGADEVTILIAMATSYRNYEDVSGDPEAITKGQIAAASRKPFRTIAEKTATDHRAIYRRVSIDLGRTAEADKPTDERIRGSESATDPALASLYFRYGRYLLITSSRPGTQPANLQGIWNDSVSPPWGSKYTVNINTEMNYWPAEPTAMPEMVEPLIAMIRDIAKTGARTAKSMYGARGWVCHHNTDLWRATAPIDGAQFGLWPMGGAWLSLHLWDRYDYGRDAKYLASVYPILKGACEFFLDTLVKDPKTGWMVTNPSLSPENNHGHGDTSLCAGPTMDMQILRALFTATAAAAGVLKTDAAFVTEIEAMKGKLIPNRIGAQGQLMEWKDDWDADAKDIHHRHVSHLFGLFPDAQINPDDTPELAAAVKKSLEIRGDKATGWATAWRINLWARLRDGDHAHRILRFLLGPERTYPNMFDAHPPFQIDGNFGGTSGVTEMLMQSIGTKIHLLPALPSAWPDGSIRGLRARGACMVDLSWKGGALAQARVVSAIGGTHEIRCGDIRRTITFQPGKAVVLTGPDLRTA
ncbi:glycosyl hydrolase family 95 catalytic domain-containing protein [Novosphingobium kaempferiae]|uniref:glycoside hydrolase family 95 protein n=1 Tax=Novosphingobium kaempferiae TaxID=2896849 RepID=UPI001E53D9E7|nr:glycoside hydrolase family 95 protein [Novosphingobium kaempferiae]